MNTGNIIPQGDVDKFRLYMASLKGTRVQNEHAHNQPPAAVSIARPAAPKPSSDLDRLIAGGYLPMLRACPPPGALTWFFDASKEPVQRISDGKVPGQFRDSAWYGLKDWRNKTPTDADVNAWRKWPQANLCLVTGDVGAFDIDVKIATAEAGAEADRARSLIDAFRSLVAETVAVEVDHLPRRWRDNSTSGVVFVRLAERMGKRIFRIADEVSDREHAIEFLASGQQVVVAGRHASGAEIRSSLTSTPLNALPTLDAAKLEAIVAALPPLLRTHGFRMAASGGGAGRELEPPFTPDVALLREVMARRLEWVPSVVPCVGGEHHEWRISSAELERDLEEDLSIYRDGVFDHGTERSHSPASMIQEFGAVDEYGDISFGGCPTYGAQGNLPFAVVGEPDASVRRPTEPEALTWLCQKLAGPEFPAFEQTATWRNSSGQIARAVGLNWETLRSIQYFEFAAGEDPTSWSAEKLNSNADVLIALRAIDPEKFARIEFAAELRGDDVDLRKIIEDRQVAVAASPQQPELSVADHTDWPDPVDIFGHDAVGDLSSLPRDCMPPMLERWIKSESRRKGVPEMFAAAAAFGAASCAVGASLRIRAKKFDDAFIQPAGLWITLVAEPGSAKSPTINAAFKPLRDLDSESFARSRPAVDAWEAAKRNQRKGAPALGPRPPIKRFTVDDATLEEQIYIHRDNPRGIGRIPDELTGLLASLGEYKKGADGDRSKMLRFFDGNGITVDRRSAGSLRADSTLMTVMASSQPAKMREITRGLGVDGMLQRFIMVLDDGAERQQHDEYPDREAATAYTEAIRRLALVEYPYCPPLKMSAAAHDVLTAAMKQIRYLRSALGLSDAWRGHVEKWGLFLPRIILTMHALEVGYSGADVDPENEIEAGTVERAVKIARLLLRHSLRFYSDYFEPNTTATEARWIAGYLLTHPDLETVKRKTITDARKDLRSDRRKLLDAMGELESLGWCTVEKRAEDGPAAWRVNPNVHVRFEEQAVREKDERLRKREAIARAGQGRKWVSEDNLSNVGAAQ
ncbi:DUF3987 domain-containing protein [Mesorhizobium sp. AR07]|uniref:DUF3987 domain-containing protein n=1 Tax=Mesorhizobium sp. AR07 TaxID=2865838 RepID=UPI002160F8B5|nr:DUF3987 domain-containing protein [Mesorhizobium sp. AR07]UVK45677.1 DUF3987 domain-containing protein [Mesorhizobium sp. AR07]